MTLSYISNPIQYLNLTTALLQIRRLLKQNSYLMVC